MSSKGGRRAQGNKANRFEEIPLKDRYERVYRPLFDQFADSGGIPIGVLESTLQDFGDQELSKADIRRLLRQADQNSDKVLNYEEFMRVMESLEKDKDLTNFQRLLRTAVSSVVPSKQLPTGETYVDHYFEYYSCCPPPLFMITVSIVELVIFIVYAKIQKGDTTWTTGAPLYSPLTYNPYRRYEAWRFISYMFIHDGIMHILSNLIFQLIIGLPLELFHKFWRVGIVYTLGVIAGSLATSIFDNKTYLVGASGGCYALIGAHFATIIMNWKNMTHDWMTGPLKFIFSAPIQLLFWSIYASVDIGVAIWSRYNNPNRVAYAAHFAGMAAGVLIGVPVLRNIEVLRWEKILFWVCLALYLLLVLFSICWNGFYPDFPPTDWRPCCPGASQP